MDDKERRELQEKYRLMEDEKLIPIVTTEKNDYIPEAVELATKELNARNIPTQQWAKKAKEISQEKQREQEEIENTPLTTKQKIAFVLIPALVQIYIIAIASRKDWKRRRKQAFIAMYIGLFVYLGIIFLIRFLYK